MVKKILIGLAALVVIFLIVVALQPSDFRIERSAKIDAPPDAVFAHVNDLHKWEDWSPWAKLDPQATNSFEGAEAGEGAVFKWSGNDEVGEGKMTIVESRPNELVNIRLDFVKPYEGTSNAEFTFQPEGDDTMVTWAMYGQNNFVGKAMCLFMNMDKMMGSNFDTGLANMKKVVEAEQTNGEAPASEPAVETPASDEPASGVPASAVPPSEAEAGEAAETKASKPAQE